MTKPGTIAGPGGLYARTREMIGRLPAVPLFYGNRSIQTVWIDDLADAIVKSVRDRITGSFAVAAGSLFYSFPWRSRSLAFENRGKFGINTPITSENLAGLKGLRCFDTREDLRRLGVRVRSFDESLTMLAKR